MFLISILLILNIINYNLHVYFKPLTMKSESTLKNNLNAVLILGTVWGISEFAVGLGLHKCGVAFTGAILTGMAFLWLSMAYSLTGRVLPVLLILLIVSVFKFSDALFLDVGVTHGSILNPVFAFLTITLGFLAMLILMRNRFTHKLIYRILTGAGAAFIAVFLFPLAGVFTGSAACIHPATSIPVSIYTSPVSITLSMITVPLGYYLAGQFQNKIFKTRSLQPGFVSYLWSPLFFLGCLITITLIRII